MHRINPAIIRRGVLKPNRTMLEDSGAIFFNRISAIIPERAENPK